MAKSRLVFSTFMLIISVVLSPMFSTGAARAQCGWMDGLSAVRMFNGPSDNRWMGTW